MSKESLENSITHSWSLFDVDWGTKSFIPERSYSFTVNGYENPVRPKLHLSNERSIVASLYTRIATDVSQIPIKHVKVNQNRTYESTIDSSLNECLNITANIDQTGRELIFDATMSMFDEGSIALVPTETNVSITNHNTFDILSLRTGKIVAWSPDQVQVELYNERTGNRETIWLEKSKVAILQNPFYAVMNEQGSVAKRLIQKLSESDAIDAKNASSKLDMFLQVPYATKSAARKKMAKERINDITSQIQSSQYGIAYIDSTEKVTPINRAIENTLPSHIQWLTELLFSQLGISKKILDGTADEQESLNYYNQTVEPILATICNETKRKFLTKTARTQGQDIMYFRNSFGLVPVNNIADIADKFTRNEILSSNEVRGIVGYKPVDDERANELRNKNINQNTEDVPISVDETVDDYEEDTISYPKLNIG